MYKTFEMELAGRPLRVDVGRVAKQANGAALMHYGETTVLSTATASEKPREGIDFFPLNVEYNEKMYAVGKIPGGFNKREGKASENDDPDRPCHRPPDASALPEGLQKRCYPGKPCPFCRSGLQPGTDSNDWIRNRSCDLRYSVWRTDSFYTGRTCKREFVIQPD